MLDTQTLTARTECYLADGKLLPFTRTKVYLDEPADPHGTELDHSRVRVDASVDWLGIVVKMRGIGLDVDYAYADDAVAVGSSMTRSPNEIDPLRGQGLIPQARPGRVTPGGSAAGSRALMNAEATAV